MDRNIEAELIPVSDIATSGANTGIWSTDLPTRLIDGHSHWVCRDSRLVLIRQIPFADKSVEFLVVLSTGDCYRVPNHERLIPLPSIFKKVGSMDQVMAAPQSIQYLLKKIEDERFIHALYDHVNERLQFELPRYALEFFINSEGELQSAQYRDYTLSICQQWKGLPLWNQYLLIENERSKKILAPNGVEIQVSHQTHNQARCALPIGSFEDIGLFVYDLHLAFANCLVASSLESRLHLASILIASGTDCPGNIVTY
jgi:hypothetical protein